MINLLIAACVVGLAGSVHCVGMCGGIISLFSARMANERKVIPLVSLHPARHILLRQSLAYNLGRIATYTTLGAIFGSVGTLGGLYQKLLPIEHVAYLLANLMIIAIGLYLTGLFPALSHIESVGQHIWARLQPALRAIMSSGKPGHRIGLGLLWGFVPCSMVYTMLLTALFSSSALNGALLMLAFGIGTLPAVISLSVAAAAGQSWLAHTQWRRWAGALIVVFGVVGLVDARHGADHLGNPFCVTSPLSSRTDSATSPSQKQAQKQAPADQSKTVTLAHTSPISAWLPEAYPIRRLGTV